MQSTFVLCIYFVNITVFLNTEIVISASLSTILVGQSAAECILSLKDTDLCLIWKALNYKCHFVMATIV